MPEIQTDRLVIIGAGLAAIYAALKLAPRPVLIISPETLGEGASSAWALGGVAAAMDPLDSPKAHAADTVHAGAGTVDADIARMVTNAAPGHIQDLTRLGAPFDRKADGSYIMSREAAHGFARVVRVKGDQAGAEIMGVLVPMLRATPSVQVLEGFLATGLLTVSGRVSGVKIAAADGSEPLTVTAPAVLLAGGGSAGLYAVTTNPPRIRGQVIGMAARAGAEIADAEFVQFHPTAIATTEDPAPLATEALRGEGARLINARGEYFMRDIHPDGELAPRDVVARAVYAQTQAGLKPMLDSRDCLGARILDEFPTIAAACARAGIDPVTQPIPIAAAAHYHMGGVASDEYGRASLPGLWVCGEAASTGLHGANRLASNGLLEGLVFAARCADNINDFIGDIPQGVPEVQLPHLSPAPSADPALVGRLRRAMTDGAGVVRDAEGLARCLQEIAMIEAAQAECETLLNMTATATLIAASALRRRESRGAHYRRDFPETFKVGKRSRYTLTQALQIRANPYQEKA